MTAAPHPTALSPDLAETPKPKRKAPPAPITYDDALIARLCERVYRVKLGDKDAASMVAKDEDDGTKLRRRAMAYSETVRCTLDALAAEVQS